MELDIYFQLHSGEIFKVIRDGVCNRLKADCTEDDLTNFVNEIEINCFNEAIRLYPEALKMIPKNVSVIICSDGKDRWIAYNNWVQKNPVTLRVPVGMTEEEILSLPEVKTHHQACAKACAKALEQARILEEKERLERAHIEAEKSLGTIAKMTQQLEGCTFLRVESKRCVVLLSPSGGEVRICSSHGVWDYYGQESDDWLEVK